MLEQCLGGEANIFAQVARRNAVDFGISLFMEPRVS